MIPDFHFVRRWRIWLGHSVANRVAFLAAVLTLLLVLSIGGASFGLARSLVQQNVQDQLDAYSNLVAQRVELALNNMVSDLAGLSGNSLIVNALVDTQSRAAYLQPFLRDYRLPTRASVRLTLVDFRGNSLSTNREDAKSYAGAAWLPLVFDRNIPHAEIMSEHGSAILVLVQPVIYPATGQAEGALVMETNLGDVLARIGFVNASDESRLMQKSTVLLAANPLSAGDEPLVSIQELDLATVLMPLQLEVQVRKSKREAVAPLDKLALAYLMIGGVILALALWYARVSARRLVEPLRRLSDVANQVSAKGDLQVSIPLAGRDEVGLLALSFDAMLGSLRHAQEHLEDKVAQRTEALQRTETRLQAVLDHVAEGILTIDEHGVIESCNLGAESLLQCDAQQVIGKNLYTLFEQRDAIEYLFDYIRHGNMEIPIQTARELNVVRADGSVFPGEIAASEMRLDERRLFVVVLRDITERHRVDRLKREFVSTVSHELRTPLTSIRGSLGLLSGGVAGVLPEQAKGMLDIANKNTERLLNLINDILDIEKIESGKMAFAMEDVELMPLVRHALETNQAYAEQYGVRYELVDDLPDAVVRVDKSRLGQVITNLLSNAAKFSPAGATVRVEVAAEQDDRVRISVIDTGPGISEEFRDKVFQRFSQADGSDTRQKGGTGLGLAISKATIEHMHGHIGFETEVGVGSTFYIELPFSEAA